MQYIAVTHPMVINAVIRSRPTPVYRLHVHLYSSVMLIGDMSPDRPNGCTVESGIVVGVVVGVCNRSQMRTSKCTCLIFGVTIGLDPG